MTETKLNEKPDESQNRTAEGCAVYDEIDDEDFTSTAKRVLERNLEAYKELAK